MVAPASEKLIAWMLSSEAWPTGTPPACASARTNAASSGTPSSGAGASAATVPEPGKQTLLHESGHVGGTSRHRATHASTDTATSELAL